MVDGIMTPTKMSAPQALGPVTVSSCSKRGFVDGIKVAN